MTVCGEKVTGVCVMGKCPHIKRCCPVVWDKYGKIKPHTNEEWLKSLDTEELAKWLHTAIFDDNFANKIADKAYMNMQTRDDYIENWLMEKHE